MSLLKKFNVILLIASITLISCKKEVKKERALFSIEPQTITVNWTGYKTTEKTAVTGQFTEIKIVDIKSDTTAIGALNAAKFDIPVSSLFSDNEVRDDKLKELFFGIMDATVSLTGTLNLSTDGTGNIELLMNGVQHKIPVTYILSGQLVEISGTMNLDDWNTQAAWESIHKACFDLHKGADGESKTWKEVGVKAVVYLKKK